MSSKNSQCETFVPMLDAFVDNELDSSEKEQVLMHVQSCDDCNRQVKEIEGLKTSLAGLPRRKMAIDLADNFDQILTKESEAASTKPSNVVPLNGKRRWIVAAASAAAVVVIAIAGSIVSKGGDQQVANSNHPNGSQSVAQKPGHPDNTAKNGINTEDKNAVADSQLPKVDFPEQNVSGTEAGNSQVINSHSAEKIAANRQSRPAENTEEGNVAKTGGAHLSEELVQNQSSNTAVVAHDQSSKTSAQSMPKNRSASSELLALYEEDDGIGSDIGMSTDEDGLYEIKL